MIKYIDGYFLWNDEGATFIVGVSHHAEERAVELFFGLFAVVIGY